MAQMSISLQFTYCVYYSMLIQ